MSQPPGGSVYVCICNAVTEDAVHACLASGSTNLREVKQGCGMKPGCGSCTKQINTMLSEWQTASELLDAITGGPANLASVSGDEVPATQPLRVTRTAGKRGVNPAA